MRLLECPETRANLEEGSKATAFTVPFGRVMVLVFLNVAVVEEGGFVWEGGESVTSRTMTAAEAAEMSLVPSGVKERSVTPAWWSARVAIFL